MAQQAPGLEQSLSQRQALSQRQLQYLRLLALDSAGLREYLEALQLENPVLQLEPPEPPEELPDPGTDYEDLPAAGSGGRDDLPVDWRGGKEALAGPGSLYDYLKSQFDVSLGGIEEGLLEVVLGALDQNGYLTCGTEELGRLAGVDPGAAREAVDYLRTLDPAGVGAYDLGDCLCLQLERRGEDDELTCALARGYLCELAKGHFSKAARQLDVPAARVRACYARLRKLDPHPGASFGREEAPYILPDVVVEREGENLRIRPCKGRIPALSIGGEYRELLRQGEAKEYLREKLAQARWVMEAIERRQHTIEAVCRVILSRQRPFFEEPLGALRPLTLGMVASELSLHPSTVSRAVAGKYLCCRRGTFPLKYFFCARGAALKGTNAGEGREAPGSDALRRRLAELVRAEDPGEPLSDSRLCALLQGEGFSVARRTVAKYRDQLGIPSVQQRATR
ncbi:RNA polymerase factor sigma-54 [Harryflintia acetispora]|uniref:RNA polymerase factor sigma-54 n=1 Tax=Harryflintia acetispora TaxID=1849041 RepID=UPI0018972B98|nr:RNA polymerase factor sigma-54 [Harryflintia acetispora]